MPYILKKTIEKVFKSKNHLLVQLKRNHPLLHGAMVRHSENEAPKERDRTHGVGKHNRIETHTASVWELGDNIGTEEWHNYFNTLIQVHRHIERFDTRKKDWVLSEDTSYCFCDLELTANATIREHWGVENKLHYIRDTRFNEGTVTGIVFLYFLQHFLCPVLSDGDYVVMDNTSVHKVDKVKQLIESTGEQR